LEALLRSSVDRLAKHITTTQSFNNNLQLHPRIVCWQRR